jgi:hypothetical protein
MFVLQLLHVQLTDHCVYRTQINLAWSMRALTCIIRMTTFNHGLLGLITTFQKWSSIKIITVNIPIWYWESCTEIVQGVPISNSSYIRTLSHLSLLSCIIFIWNNCLNAGFLSSSTLIFCMLPEFCLGDKNKVIIGIIIFDYSCICACVEISQKRDDISI